ncbi:unnamed protein product [Porites evermanni]|uniref:DNA-directed DNA polymerase n=1 Tax=Porites evermanni TaxID=104178 RepID=A0ABN8LH69_9CNID|nr:unnamed protein product [Porites evermanni]
MQQNYHLTFEQLQDAEGEVLGEVLTETVMRGLRQVVVNEGIEPVAKQNKTGNADPEAPLDDDSDEEDKKAPPPPPIPVFADIECCQGEDRVFHANLVCWSSAEEDTIHHSDKIEDFLAALEELTGVEGDERERKVVSFFHNMRGFDGNFILEKLYDQGRAVEKPLTQGAKIMSFETGNLVFKVYELFQYGPG